MNPHDPKHPEEIAFRRGVHHGLHALLEYCEKANPLVGWEACLAEAVTRAREMRYDETHHDWYTHELVNRIKDMVRSHDETYLDEEDRK